MISDNNTRILITIPKETEVKLVEMSKKENRSLNNMIVTIINKYLETQP